MRFCLVDRLVALEAGQAIEVLKNVSASEDVFDDHFPGFAVLPGALIVEVWAQAAQLLIAATHGSARVGRLERLARVSFRHFVRPGDQLRARCERRPGRDARWTLAASADVDGRRVAAGVLELALEDVVDGAERGEHAARVEAMLRTLRAPTPALAPTTVAQARRVADTLRARAMGGA